MFTSLKLFLFPPTENHRLRDRCVCSGVVGLQRRFGKIHFLIQHPQKQGFIINLYDRSMAHK